MRKIFALLCATSVITASIFSNSQDQVKPLFPQRVRAGDLKPDYKKDESASFSVPVAIASAHGLIFVVDSQECEVRVFSQEGRFLKALGRKGQAPGEFNSPADIDFFENKIYVSDRFNSRVQILDESGSYLQSFRVPLNPDHICVLSPEAIVVSQLPLGINGKEKLIYCLSPRGEVLWERGDSVFSGDRVYDTFRNLIILSKGSRADCFLIWKCDRREIEHYDKRGRALERIIVSPDYSFKSIALPLGGKRKELQGFCWDSVLYRDEFYLLAPEYTMANDLGPGRRVFVLDKAGRITRTIELPDAVKRIALSQDRVFAIDLENNLRIFGFEKK